MDIKTALYSLGVRDDTLSAGEKRSLDEDGYLPLPGILTPAQVHALRNRLQELEDEEGEDAGKEVHQEDGTDRLANLANKDPLFDQVWANPKVLAAMAHVLEGDLKLSSLNARAALPGHGLQALHCDGSHNSADFAPVMKDGRRRYKVCNSIWLLSDFTPENGATRLVPGSHLFGVDPGNGMEDPKAPHPDEILVQGKAGTVFVFNAFTWHGGTVNRSDSPRRALHCYYCRRDLKSQTDQSALFRPETAARISEAQRVVLGV
ncbi:MAG: phytanoyl-CoA dioxygenase family protein [Caldilineaceae bacterium]|nr:phytanoyl-CoA dioxygenase family protein [Caldilineaceae bacterium]